MRLYTLFGQPGGGGSLSPACSFSLIYGIVAYQGVTSEQNYIVHATHLFTRQVVKRGFPKTPNLIEQTAIAPNITGSRVLAVTDGFRGHPGYRNFTSL